ncbi:hypothetical protein GF382_03505 [Candidatus Falkowbacteria bacterium]|nr:hypothetical protein [Candidatus Falkowbacteria bacterium]
MKTNHPEGIVPTSSTINFYLWFVSYIHILPSWIFLSNKKEPDRKDLLFGLPFSQALLLFQGTTFNLQGRLIHQGAENLLTA